MAESPSIHSDVIEKNIKLRQQVREFKGENENLRKNIEVLLKEYGFSKNKRKRELQLENEKLCLENLDLNYCVAYLHCENQALRQQVQAKESAYELNDQELKSALEQLKSNLKMPSKHKEFDMEKLALQEKVEDLQTDNQAFRAENDDIIRNMCELKENFQKEKNKMRQQIQALQNDIREANATLETFKGFKEMYEQLKQENESLNNQNQDLKQEIETKNIAVQEEIQELKSVLQGLKSVENDSNRIRQQNNALEQEVQELTKKLADCQKEMRQNEEALHEKMRRKHEEYDMEKLKLEFIVEDLESNNLAFRSEHDATIRSMCDLKQTFQKEKNKMRQQIQSLQNDIQEANATLETFKEFKGLYEELKQENESLNNQNQDLKQEIEAKNIAIQEEVQEIKSVLQGLKSFEEESNRIKQQNNALEQEVQELTKKLADCQKEMRQNEEALQEKMQVPDKGEPHQSSFELTPNSNESTEKEERIKTSENTDLEEKNKDIPTESSSHMETPQEQTFKPSDVEEKDQRRWITWLQGAALHFAFSDYIYPHF
ncbi:ankycorbin-like isoform X1 [Oreochromis niloticus]|uniref:ankycorbin-like isoform X1 n=1 Tax=Oreochromis niloticus TaxID=8128 RepID=UPI000904D55C|nr:ankycorbin-like isoform X1 [Oreochromis niloticus]